MVPGCATPASHNAGAIVELAVYAGVRDSALVTLGKLDKAALALDAGAIVDMFMDSDAGVRYAAMRALGRFEPAMLASHTGAIVDMFVDSDAGVRYEAIRALGKVEPTMLTSHVGAIVGLLEDTEIYVTSMAVRALVGFDQAALASHAGAIAHDVLCMLTNPNVIVRYDALRLSESVALGMLTPDVFARMRSAVAHMLTDTEWGMRIAAEWALFGLKTHKARAHWAIARAFVQVYRVRPYALFWHAYAGEILCAPGGKWAERDRAAFEAEFGALRP